jgi:hypothetical protein
MSVVASPSSVSRNKAISILEHFEAPSSELSRLIKGEVRRVYDYLTLAQVLGKEKDLKATALLVEHLEERGREILEGALRLIAHTAFDDRKQVIMKALHSQSRHDRENAVEAIESSLHPSIRRTLIPLLEERPLEEKPGSGNKNAGLGLDGTALAQDALMKLIGDEDPITRVLALYTASEIGLDLPEKERLALVSAEDPVVRDAARWTVNKGGRGELLPDQKIYGPHLLDRIVLISSVPIFEDLSVSALFSIAAKTSVRCYRLGEFVVREGDPGDALYLVMDGTLAVVKYTKYATTLHAIVLDRIEKGSFFGEMAILDGQKRSADVKVESEAQLLVLKAADFVDVVKDHPAVAVQIGKVLAGRIRALQRRLQASR